MLESLWISSVVGCRAAVICRLVSADVKWEEGVGVP